MNLVWKILLPLALLLPAVGYVAGALASPGVGDQPPRETIVITNDSATGDPQEPVDNQGSQQGSGKDEKGDDGRGNGKEDRSGSDRGPDDARPDDDDDGSDDIDEVQPEPDDWTNGGGGGGGDDQTRTRSRSRDD